MKKTTTNLLLPAPACPAVHLQVLLTGASGYLGQHILASILLDGNDDWEKRPIDIVALCSNERRAQELQVAVNNLIETKKKTQQQQLQQQISISVRAYDFENESSEQLAATLKNHKFDVCIHTGALSSPRICHEAPGRAHTINVPRCFLTAIHDMGCQIIALSTDQVYGGDRPPYKESDLTNPLNVYAQTKVELEAFLLSLSDRDGVVKMATAKRPMLFKSQHIILRSSIILGPLAPIYPSLSHDTFLHFCQSRRDVATDFFTDEKRSVVFVQDVVNVIRWLVDHRNDVIEETERDGIYNIGGPKGVSRMEIAELVFEHLQYSQSKLVPRSKGRETSSPSSLVSPLDITMDVRKIQELTLIQMTSLRDVVENAFP